MVIAICSLLCGAQGFNDMVDFGQARHDWFKTFLRLRNGIPSHDTFGGCIVTLDPLGCQRKIAKEIIEADADYVLALKGNQETVHEEVKRFLDALLVEQQTPLPKGAKPSGAVQTLQSCQTVDKDHGRLEVRRCYQSERLDWFADRANWEGLRSVGMVESEREIKGEKTVERRYYLSAQNRVASSRFTNGQ